MAGLIKALKFPCLHQRSPAFCLPIKIVKPMSNLQAIAAITVPAWFGPFSGGGSARLSRDGNTLAREHLLRKGVPAVSFGMRIITIHLIQALYIFKQLLTQ